MFLGLQQVRLANGPEPEPGLGGHIYLVGLGIFIKPKSLGADSVDRRYSNSPQEDFQAGNSESFLSCIFQTWEVEKDHLFRMFPGELI